MGCGWGKGVGAKFKNYKKLEPGIYTRFPWKNSAKISKSLYASLEKVKGKTAPQARKIWKIFGFAVKLRKNCSLNFFPSENGFLWVIFWKFITFYLKILEFFKRKYQKLSKNLIFNSVNSNQKKPDRKKPGSVIWFWFGKFCLTGFFWSGTRKKPEPKKTRSEKCLVPEPGFWFFKIAYFPYKIFSKALKLVVVLFRNTDKWLVNWFLCKKINSENSE